MTNSPKLQTAKELSAVTPWTEEYIRAAMHHEEFVTYGSRPAYASLDDCLRFFREHPEFRIRTIYRRRKGQLRTV